MTACQLVLAAELVGIRVALYPGLLLAVVRAWAGRSPPVDSWAGEQNYRGYPARSGRGRVSLT